MHRLLIILALVSPAIAGDAATDATKAKIPAISLLPNGSQLKGVMLPRYDENHKQVGVLKAELMTLVNSDQIDGTKVTIEFFNPDQSPRARIDLVKATFYQDKGLVATKEPVEIKSDRMTASGSGLHYSFTGGKGFLSGPVCSLRRFPQHRPRRSQQPTRTRSGATRFPRPPTRCNP